MPAKTTIMNELQRTEFEILKEFDAVCRKLELPYFLVCGSALGAVKYGGFIPWDDDVDVAMYRQDYLRFMNEAPALLPKHLFLQNYRSDPAFPHIFGKLRNSGTAYIETAVAELPIHHGIYIDIFPLDGFPKGRLRQKWLIFRKRLLASMLLSVCDVPRSGLSRITYPLFHALGVRKNTARIAAVYERIISSYPTEGSDVICNHGNWQGSLEYAPVRHYGEGAEMSFETLTIRVPEAYDDYLRQKYGNYWQDLPESEKHGHHHYTVCDCDRPYTEYVGK